MYKTQLRKNDFFLIASHDINELCKPLQKVGITYFTFLKSFRDHSQIHLSNNARWIEDYYNLALYKSSYFERSIDLYQTGQYLWQQTDNTAVFAHGRNYFDSVNGVTLIQRNKDNCEFYSFAGSLHKPWLNNFYFSNIDLLKKFIHYFHESANEIIQTAQKDRIIIKDRCDITTNPYLDADFITLRADFLKDIHFNENRINLLLLTAREKEVMYNLLKGHTAKETSVKMHISPKTIARHLENIKEKLGSHNKIDLIRQLLLSEQDK